MFNEQAMRDTIRYHYRNGRIDEFRFCLAIYADELDSRGDTVLGAEYRAIGLGHQEVMTRSERSLVWQTRVADIRRRADYLELRCEDDTAEEWRQIANGMELARLPAMTFYSVITVPNWGGYQPVRWYPNLVTGKWARIELGGYPNPNQWRAMRRMLDFAQLDALGLILPQFLPAKNMVRLGSRFKRLSLLLESVGAQYTMNAGDSYWRLNHE